MELAGGGGELQFSFKNTDPEPNGARAITGFGRMVNIL